MYLKFIAHIENIQRVDLMSDGLIGGFIHIRLNSIPKKTFYMTIMLFMMKDKLVRKAALNV